MLVGVGLVASSFFVPVEYTDPGGRTLEGWGVAMIGLATLVVGFTWGTAWRKTGLLTALMVLGWSAQLTLTRPHWAMSLRVSPDELERVEHYLSVVVLIVQGVVTLLLALPRIRGLIRVGTSLASPIRVVGAATIFLFCSANVAAMYPDVFAGGYQTQLYVRWWVLAALFFSVNLGLLWQIGCSAPAGPLDRWAARLSKAISLPGYDGPPRPGDARLPWLVAAFVLAVTLLFVAVVMRGSALLDDEVVIQFMARTLATGRLGVEAPPVAEAFEMYMVELRDGVRFGTWIPGWPMVLSLGAFFHVPWLVNPVLGASSVLVAHSLTRRWTDRGTANVTVLLLATSPWFLVLSSVYQPHALTLLAALVTWWGVHRAASEGATRWALVAGLAAGVAFSVRPMDGVVLGASGLLYGVLKMGGKRISPAAVATFLGGCVATGAVSLVVNYVMTGDPTSYPMNEYFDRVWGPGANRLGFGADVGQVWGGLDPIPGHGWRDVLFNLNLNSFTLNYDLFGWGVGSLFLLGVHLLWGRLTRLDRACLFFMVGAIALYSLYWFNGGPDYGPRYWYSTLFPLLFLSIRGLDTLTRGLRRLVPGPDVAQRVGLAFAILCCSSLVVYGSWRPIAKYVEYRISEPELAQLARSGAFGDNGLVIVRPDGDREYAALELNSLVPGEDGPVFALDLGPEVVSALIEAFPGRPVFFVRFETSPNGKTVSVSARPPG